MRNLNVEYISVYIRRATWGTGFISARGKIRTHTSLNFLVMFCSNRLSLNSRVRTFDRGSLTGDRYCDEIVLPHMRLFRGAIGLDFCWQQCTSTQDLCCRGDSRNWGYLHNVLASVLSWFKSHWTCLECLEEAPGSKIASSAEHQTAEADTPWRVGTLTSRTAR